MDTHDRDIMVVDRATMFANGYFQGFSPASNIDYYGIICDHYFYEKRHIVESKPELKQPIAYCVIVNAETGKVFAYQRSSKESHYRESRLRGKWSWGIGGHIDKIDSEGEDPIVASLLREIGEEVSIPEFEPPRIVGYINDDETEVGQVHFGLLFLVKTRSSNVKPKGKEIAWGGFLSIEELEEIYSSNEVSVESWSGISLEPVRKEIEALMCREA